VEEADNQVANHERPEEATSERQSPWSTPDGRLDQHDQRPAAAVAGKQREGAVAARGPPPHDRWQGSAAPTS
jgi:hypothetical protein